MQKSSLQEQDGKKNQELALLPGRRKTKERPGRRGKLNGISLTEIEKIYSEIFVLEAQKKKHEIISEFSEANMCQSIIDHLMELIEYKKDDGNE